MRFYRALLHLYPATFRREYGGEMESLFKARLQQHRGALALLTLWTETFWEISTSAAAVHWDLLGQDLRYTARTLRRAPGFTVTAVLVTALGIGANTAAFSVADFVLIRPLPFVNPDRLVKVWEATPGYSHLELSPPNYRDWKAMNQSFDAMGAFTTQSINLTGQGDPQRLQGTLVTADLLPLLGVRPMLGRAFTVAEESDGAASSVILSYGLWQSAFGGGTILGRTVTLDGTPRVVIGVMPPDFHFPNRDIALWTPMPFKVQSDPDRSNNYWEAVGRLRSGVTVAQAQADMNRAAGKLEVQFPVENKQVASFVAPLRDEFSQQSRLLLLALCGAALCVLLIACANLANLLLARSLVRQRELVLRTALGAGRERLVRQLITESLVLAVLGGTLGILIAVAAVPLLTQLVPNSLPIAQSPSIDIRVLVFAALLSAATGIAFGVLPALRASRADFDALRDGGRSGGGRRSRLRSVLVMVEVMASVVLLISSGLLMRALTRIEGTDPGFKAEGVLALRTVLPSPKYDLPSQREQFYQQVLSGVQSLPGVSSAAYVSGLPMVMGGGLWPVVFPGDEVTRGSGKVASMRFATPGYFDALGIPLKKGRGLAETDVVGQRYVAVVSESFVKQYFPGSDPVGKRFKFGIDEREIVGVVGDIRVRGLERPSEPQVYLPYKQQNANYWAYNPKDLVIRSTGPAAPLAAAVREIIRTADPEQPISSVQTLSAIVASQTASRSVQVRVLGAFALIAFLLAGIGIHGVLSYAVSSRKHEIGVRMALGAQPNAIIGMVMRQGALMAAAGVLPGMAIAYGAGRWMQSLLAGVTPADAATFLAAAALCVVMTLLGSLLPVLRAVRVPPASAFRAE